MDFIQPCLEMVGLDSDFLLSIAWSIFIAACDAATKELQELSLKSLEAVDDCGMFIKQGKLSTMAKAVWERRESCNDFSFGWPELMILEQADA